MVVVDEDFDDEVAELDVDDGRHGFLPRSHQGRSETHPCGPESFRGFEKGFVNFLNGFGGFLKGF